MARFKVNETAIIKESGKKCVIKGIETRHAETEDGHKRTDVTYVARTEDGDWGFLRRHELEKLNTELKPKVPFMVFDADKGWKVVVVGIREYIGDKIFKKSYGKIVCLSIGFSIYNPVDKWDLKQGIRVAKYRAKKRPLAEMISYRNTNEFGKETIEGIMRAKGEYILNNLEKFAKEYGKTN